MLVAPNVDLDTVADVGAEVVETIVSAGTGPNVGTGEPKLNFGFELVRFLGYKVVK